MRIGMMADVYKPHISGITNYITQNKKALEVKGHEVFVFTFGDEDYPDDEDHIIRSPGLPLIGTDYYLSFRYKKAARSLLYTMDIVHLHHPFFSGSLAIQYCRPRGIPIIFTNHTRYDLYAQSYLPIVPDVISETMLQAYLPSFCRSIDQVIAPSEGMRQVLLRLGVDVPIMVVPNGVDLELFRKVYQPVTRSELGFSAEDTLLVYLGRLGPEKNMQFLLRSFAGITQAYENVCLLIVGDGPERRNLEDLADDLNIQSRVHFTGMVPYIDVPGYLQICDAFVTASVTEVHPLSVIEAMAAGLPVLGISSPGIADTIEDGKTGYLSSDDLAAFTAKMVKLITERESRKKMGEQARHSAQAYDIEHTTSMMLDVYKQLVEKTRLHRPGWRTRLNNFLDNWRP